MSRSLPLRLAALSMGQDAVIAFFLVSLSAVLRDGGVSLHRIAVINLLTLLWTARFLWAPIVDRFGRYRAWLVGCQLVMLTLLGWIATIDPVRELTSLMIAVAVLVVVSATQESALNGLTIGLLSPRQRTIAGGLLLAAVYTGSILGGTGVLTVYAWHGWPVAMLALGVVVTLPALALRRLPDPPKIATRAGLREMFGLVRRPGVLPWLVLILPLYLLGFYVGEALLMPLLVDLGWSLPWIGTMRILLMCVAGLLVAPFTGLLIQRLGIGRSLAVCGSAMAASSGLFVLVTAGVGGPVLVAVVVCAQAITGTCTAAVALTIALRMSDSAHGATDVSLQSASSGFCRALTLTGAVAAAGTWGYTSVAVVAVAAVALGSVLAVRRHPLRLGVPQPDPAELQGTGDHRRPELVQPREHS